MGELDKNNFCISIAGHTVALHTLYTEMFSLCEHYLSDNLPDLCVSIKETDIEAERIEASKTNVARRDSYLETLVIYRKLSEEMLSFDTFLMHGAVVAIGNNAYMFTAKSGTGKTTHIKKWIENVEGAYVVNGDKPLIKVTDKQVIACGTPWCGKEHWGTNTMVPLKAIVLMERWENNSIEEVTFGQASSFLLNQTHWPKDYKKMRKTFLLFSQMKNKVLFYKYRFNNYKDDVFDTVYNAITAATEEI